MDMQYNGRGPLVSARLVDQDLLWGRAEQLLAACTEDHENLRVRFHEANDGGCVTRLGGLLLFLPASLITKAAQEFLTAEVPLPSPPLLVVPAGPAARGPSYVVL